MNLKSICIAFILLSITQLTFSQVDSTFKDTITEITIYEYDTIYLQADTIRFTDTVYDIVKINLDNKQQIDSANLSFSQLFSFFLPVLPNSVGIEFCPLIAGNLRESKISDSLSLKPVISYRFSFQLNYYNKKYLISLGAGYSFYNEQILYRSSYNSSNIETSISGIYDSLLISKDNLSYYHFNYFNINVFLGRKLKINKNWHLDVNIGCITDFLSAYRQGNADYQVNMLRKFDISLILNPHLFFKSGKIAEFYLSPFYQHSLLHNNTFPYSSFQKAGLSIGCNIKINKS